MGMLHRLHIELFLLSKSDLPKIGHCAFFHFQIEPKLISFLWDLFYALIFNSADVVGEFESDVLCFVDALQRVIEC
jgi:hypothetical protein